MVGLKRDEAETAAELAVYRCIENSNNLFLR